jgi:hypothetical protein
VRDIRTVHNRAPGATRAAFSTLRRCHVGTSRTIIARATGADGSFVPLAPHSIETVLAR